MSEKIEIPEGVVDRKQYLKYVVLDRNPILKEKLLTASDGTEINIALLPHVFRKKIEHLPPKEQEYFLERKRRYTHVMAKRNIAKGMAFGNMGRNPSKSKDETEARAYQKKAEIALEQDIVTLLGRMFSVAEVVRILVEDNGIAISAEKVKQVLAKNITAIEKQREEFRNKVTDVRLYNKRPRLEELAWMYSKMKMRYITMNGSVEAYNAMLRTLEQIRKEAEGDIINLNGNIDVNIQAELQAHIQKEVIKTINLKEIILGRIAARMNYDCDKLVAGLHNSYYAQFVQISGDYNPDAEMQYPSLVNYDFADIERKNAERDDVVEVQAEPVTEEQHEKAQSIKALFLSKIKRQQERYEQRTSTSIVEQHDLAFGEDYGEVERSGRRYRYDQHVGKEQRKPYRPRAKKEAGDEK